MGTRNLLYRKDYPINKEIKIIIPTVGEILDNEDSYYNLVSVLTAMPIDMMVQLDSLNIDFTQLSEYDLFLYLFEGLKQQDTSMIFGELDLTRFHPDISKQNGNLILYDPYNDITIDKAIHNKIATILRLIHNLKKNTRKPANEEAKAFMLERAKSKMRRRKNKTEDSWLESLIVAMVNTEQYKYDFEGTRSLSIYQFNESVRQVIKKVDYDNKMYGVYTGSINVKELNQDDLNWLVHK